MTRRNAKPSYLALGILSSQIAFFGCKCHDHVVRLGFIIRDKGMGSTWIRRQPRQYGLAADFGCCIPIGIRGVSVQMLGIQAYGCVAAQDQTPSLRLAALHWPRPVVYFHQPANQVCRCELVSSHVAKYLRITASSMTPADSRSLLLSIRGYGLIDSVRPFAAGTLGDSKQRLPSIHRAGYLGSSELAFVSALVRAPSCVRGRSVAVAG